MLDFDFYQITNYCERGESLWFWAEPWNLWSNLAFFASALACLILLWSRKTNVKSKFWYLTLIAMTALTGVGSALLHTMPIYWTRWFDVVPLSLWILIFLGKFYSSMGFSKSYVVWVYIFFFGLNYIALAHFDSALVVKSNYYYATALMALFGSWLAHLRGFPTRYLWAGTLLFGLSLTFRILDHSICPSFPVGTHFLWHTCNATVIYLLFHGLVKMDQHQASST